MSKYNVILINELVLTQVNYKYEATVASAVQGFTQMPLKIRK